VTVTRPGNAAQRGAPALLALAGAGATVWEGLDMPSSTEEQPTRVRGCITTEVGVTAA
jgi:hypothetical protein